MSAFDYWASGSGLENITPRGKAWPEGDDFSAFLAEVVGDVTVVEFGCGIGRLAGIFDPRRYLGLDICPAALMRARAARPEYEFVEIDDEVVLPSRAVTLVHTVLLHVPDECLERTIGRFASERVIVSEILGRHWRRGGNPPVFNREIGDYEAAFAPRYHLVGERRRPYPHYRDTDLSIMEFRLGPVRDASRPADPGGPVG